MPITAARRMYSPIAVRPIPTEREITRSLAPQAYFRRRTSRTFHIDNLSAGIRPPLRFANGGPCPAQTADNAPRITPSTGWPPSVGLGGRFRSESLAAFRRNRWPHASDSAKATTVSAGLLSAEGSTDCGLFGLLTAGVIMPSLRVIVNNTRLQGFVWKVAQGTRNSEAVP